MSDSIDVFGWFLVAVGVWILFEIALHIREAYRYWKRRGVVVTHSLQKEVDKLQTVSDSFRGLK